jgi:hypothetical protein
MGIIVVRSAINGHTLKEFAYQNRLAPKHESKIIEALPVANAPITNAAMRAKNSSVEICPSTLKPDQPTDTRSRWC